MFSSHHVRKTLLRLGKDMGMTSLGRKLEARPENVVA